MSSVAEFLSRRRGLQRIYRRLAHHRILLVIGLILGLSMFMVLLNDTARDFLAKKVWPPLKRDYVPWFVGGVLGSLVASVALMFLRDRPAWQDDVGSLKKAFADLETRVDRALRTADVERFERILKELETRAVFALQRYESLLDRLPEAIGGAFTKSLFSYHPTTSERIAQILSSQTAAMFHRHCRRVAVETAADTYHLRGIKTLQVSAQSCDVWELRFHSTWTWINDSQVTQMPLRDLTFVISAPTGAWEAFGTNAKVDLDDARAASDEFFRTRNLVGTTLKHPQDDAEASRFYRLDLADVDKLWGLESVDIKVGGKRLRTIRRAEMEETKEPVLPVLVYRALRLPPRAREEPLEVGGRLVVEYTGGLCLPVAESGAAEMVFGALVYPPSDVVTGSYSLTMIYAKENCEIDRENSGCFYLHERRLGSWLLNPANTDPGLPPGFRAGRGEEICRLLIEEPLTELHEVRLLWKGKRR
jgi:hypothetical protein